MKTIAVLSASLPSLQDEDLVSWGAGNMHGDGIGANAEAAHGDVGACQANFSFLVWAETVIVDDGNGLVSTPKNRFQDEGRRSR